MKASKYFIPTTKEDPQDAVVASHKLMVRAGLIRKSGSGLYQYLPLGLRVLRKVESIVREEMDQSGALEFQLPILTPAEFWEISGRWSVMGKEMFRLKDRHENWNCLGPTHEESFCALLKPLLRSYKDLPINVYQIHTKFRDEIRPRFGVIRSREFTMKDAYSFHLDDDCLEKTYQIMRTTYRKIFNRMGLKTLPVEADSGNMGGSKSEEFMVISPIGEETLMICKNCGYSSNLEKTPVVVKNSNTDLKSDKPIHWGEKTHTPSCKSIEDIASFFSVLPSQCLKGLAYSTNGFHVLIFLPGDRELNEAKLKNALTITELNPMDTKELEKIGFVAGFIGPKENYPENLKVIIDQSVNLYQDYIVGGNEWDYHKKGFNFNGNIGSAILMDVALAKLNDPCPNCNSPLSSEKGIEVGHIFQLGTKYTEAFGIQVLDDKGKSRLLTMGCYGIGVNRCMAAVIEQRNDDKGIIWPISVAPFEICIVSITKTQEEKNSIESIYQYLQEKGLEVLWDDRDLGPGFKFKDSELIGYPIRVTIGKNYFEKKEVSILIRSTGEEIHLPINQYEDLVNELRKIRNQLYKELEI